MLDVSASSSPNFPKSKNISLCLLECGHSRPDQGSWQLTLYQCLGQQWKLQVVVAAQTASPHILSSTVLIHAVIFTFLGTESLPALSVKSSDILFLFFFFFKGMRSSAHQQYLVPTLCSFRGVCELIRLLRLMGESCRRGQKDICSLS